MLHSIYLFMYDYPFAVVGLVATLVAFAVCLAVALASLTDDDPVLESWPRPQAAPSNVTVQPLGRIVSLTEDGSGLVVRGELNENGRAFYDWATDVEYLLDLP